MLANMKYCSVHTLIFWTQNDPRSPKGLNRPSSRVHQACVRLFKPIRATAPMGVPGYEWHGLELRKGAPSCPP